jgi:cardiolipin synthase A/B
MARARCTTAFRVSRYSKVIELVMVGLVGISIGVGIPIVASACRLSKAKETFELAETVPDSGRGLELAIFQSVGAHLRTGHHVTLLENGAVFDALVADIGRARSSIDIVMYIWEPGVASNRISTALIERAKAGIACRILVDDLGSADFERTIKPPLAAAGCEVRVFRRRPSPDLLARNHRKVVVIDGSIAFTGGLGIRDSWLGDGIHDGAWRDSNVRFTGPSVAEAQQAFAENWQEAGGALLPDSAFPEPDKAAAGSTTAAFVASSASPVITHAERLTQLVIASATKRLWITNAYFVPSIAILDLLKRKAAAGVDVRLLMPGEKSDSKASFVAQQTEYPGLLAAGIRVWEYTPSMIHSKTMLANTELVVIGSINLDPLSLNKLEESALVIDAREVAAEVARQFEADCQHAHELTR